MNFPCNHLQLQKKKKRKKRKKRKKAIWGRDVLFNFTIFFLIFFCGSYWSEPLVLLLCCSIFLFVLHDQRIDSCICKLPFSSYLTCVVNNTWTPDNKYLVQMKFAAQLFLMKRTQRWWKGINFEIWTSLCRKYFFFLSHLSLSKASECFMGLNGTLYFAEWAALYGGAISSGLVLWLSHCIRPEGRCLPRGLPEATHEVIKSGELEEPLSSTCILPRSVVRSDTPSMTNVTFKKNPSTP